MIKRGKFIEFDKAKNLILRFGYDKIYTSQIKKFGNSAHVTCCKNFKGQQVLIFILKERGKKK